MNRGHRRNHSDGGVYDHSTCALRRVNPRVPRSTVIRRLDRLQSWGLIYRQGRRYYMHDKALNSFLGMRSYQASRRLLTKATEGFDHFGHFAASRHAICYQSVTDDARLFS